MILSHPSRVRELKPFLAKPYYRYAPSHPSRVRELKHTNARVIAIGDDVAPLPGA